MRHFGNHAVLFLLPFQQKLPPVVQNLQHFGWHHSTNCLCCTSNFATRVAVFHIFARFLHTPVWFAQRRCKRAFFLPPVSPFFATFGLQLLHEVFNQVLQWLARHALFGMQRHNHLFAVLFCRACCTLCWLHVFFPNSCVFLFAHPFVGKFFPSTVGVVEFFVATSAVTLFFKLRLMPALCLVNVATSAVVFCWWCGVWLLQTFARQNARRCQCALCFSRRHNSLIFLVACSAQNAFFARFGSKLNFVAVVSQNTPFVFAFLTISKMKKYFHIYLLQLYWT